MKRFRAVPLLIIVTSLGALAPAGRTQSAIDFRVPSSVSDAPASASAKPAKPIFVYNRPTEKMKLRTYVFDAFGPYPIVGAAFIAAVNQRENTPPEWGQGASAYGQRFGSNLAIAGVTTTTRYALAEDLPRRHRLLPL